MRIGFYLMLVLGASIHIAAIIAVVRFKQINRTYRPFIFLIWFACFNEALSVYLMYQGFYTIVNNSIFELFESIFLLWFFKELGTIKSKTFFYSLILLFILAWSAEIIFVTHLTKAFIRYFNGLYYLCLVLLSIRTINNLLFTERELSKNPTFLICIGMIIFFTYGAISKMFWLFDVEISTSFRSSVQSIYMIINFLANLIYALAVLWMRKRQAFTLQF